MLFYFFMLPLLVRSQISFWDKHYITYSVENDFHLTKTINDAIKEMEINTLELENVNPGKGDIKFYFVNYLRDEILGTAEPPDGGKITIDRNKMRNININISKVIQHEFAHALGLDHSTDNNSIMFTDYMQGASFLKTDKDKLNELYKCRYDSVTLLDDKTYIKFKGSNYEIMNFSTESITKNKVWHPSIFKVNAMYKNNTYFIIANNFEYYKFNQSMHLIKEGYIRDIFPNIDGIISAVLTLRNGSIICFFEDGDISFDGLKVDKNLFEILPKDIIQGAISTFNRIYLIVKDYIYTYDEDFMFITQTRLCDHPKFRKIHCCNGYSNM